MLQKQIGGYQNLQWVKIYGLFWYILYYIIYIPLSFTWKQALKLSGLWIPGTIRFCWSLNNRYSYNISTHVEVYDIFAIFWYFLILNSFNVLFCGNLNESTMVELMLWFENKLLIDWNRIVRSNLVSHFFSLFSHFRPNERFNGRHLAANLTYVTSG